MAYVVGPKGQIVIAKEISDRLGVEPGWIALQQQVDDHVEVYLLPPEHRKSLKGNLAKYTNVHVALGEEWDKAREFAWDEAAAAREARVMGGEKEVGALSGYAAAGRSQ